MKIGKRVLKISLVLAICVSMLGSFSVSASAASISTYPTMDAIPEDVDVFNTMAKGAISAVKVSGVWYYQFTRSGYDTIRVKASAFATTSHTNAYLAADNAALTNSVNSTTGTRNDIRINYYVSTKKSTERAFWGPQLKTPVGIDMYTTTRCRYELSAFGATSDKITLISKLTHYVKFVYASKVLVDTHDVERRFISIGTYVTPANAYEYVKALDRSLTGSEITPNIELSITNTGNLGAYLNTYTLSGQGKAAAGTNVSKLISVGYKTIKLAVSAKPSFSTLYELFSLIGDIAALSPSSNQYNTGLMEPLSMKNIFVYKAKYVSPIKLKACQDYLQVVTDFANIKSGYSGRGTAQLKVVFSFS